jgi:cytochrome c-type biogenesis protein CcmH
MWRSACLLVLVLFFCNGLQAAIDPYEFKNEDQRHLFQKMAEELRCPKCQNQNLADSDSQIAADLRKELYQQLMAGKSEQDIIDFMRDRYGDFVLYKPRMQWNTVFLWAAPFFLIFLVVVSLWCSRRSQSEKLVAAHAAQAISTKNALQKPLLSARGINAASLLIAVLVASGSLLLYHHMGALRAVQITDLGQAVFLKQFPRAEQEKQQAALLAELDDWLSDHPDDDRFIYMRARLLSESGLWDRAIRDYQQLIAQFPDQDNFIAEYGQALFLKNNRRMNAESEASLQRALNINPHNVMALGLLGMSAFEKKDYRTAADLWSRLQQLVPPNAPQAAAIAEGVSRARQLAGLPSETAAVSSDIRLTVRVNIAATVDAKPDETVFVLLRAQQGPRMPLAAVKTTVAALVNAVTLDTATSPMKGQMDFSAINTFEVVARLSRSGQPIPAAGDWEGVSEPLQRQHLPAELRVTIAQEINQ